MSPRRRKWLCAALIALAGLLLYGHTLRFPFVFDDYIYLTGNPLVQSPSSFSFPFHFKEFATRPRRLGLDPDLSVNFILRPVAYLTFYANYAVDGMNPVGFRAVNILVHCANGVLVYLLLAGFLGAKRDRRMPEGSAEFIALFSGLMFIAHPLAIESVTYIVQRFTSLSAFFYLLSILAFFRVKPPGAASGSWPKAAMAILGTGMLVKEDMFTAPFMILLLDRTLMGHSWKIAWQRCRPCFLLLPIIPTLMFLTSWATNKGSLSGALNIANSWDAPVSQFAYLVTEFRVILTYLERILLPVGLNIDPDFPLSTSLLDPAVFGSLLCLAGIVAAAFFAWLPRQKDPRWSLLLCGALWFFVTIAPSSSIAPLPDLMAEHRSYLPSIGAIVALVCAADLLRTAPRLASDLRMAIPAFMAVWVALLMGANVARNSQWRSNVELWGDVVSKSPKKGRPWVNLAAARFEQRDFAQAAYCLERVLEIAPNRVATYMDLGKVYNAMGEYQKTLAISRAGLAREHSDPQILMNQAQAQWQLNRRQESLDSMLQAERIQPQWQQVHASIGFALAELGQWEESLRELRAADSLTPGNPVISQKIAEVDAHCHSVKRTAATER